MWEEVRGSVGGGERVCGRNERECVRGSVGGGERVCGRG